MQSGLLHPGMRKDCFILLYFESTIVHLGTVCVSAAVVIVFAFAVLRLEEYYCLVMRRYSFAFGRCLPPKKREKISDALTVPTAI
jgi:hypothetical protein